MHKFIHLDADSFFAAVEIRDNPKLLGKPVAVGGDPGRRGVIATCSYEARRYGVRSAMASAQAKRLCPELEIVKPRMAKYKQASEQIMHIFQHYSDRIEPLSLDEAFIQLDQTSIDQTPICHGSATLVAKEIRQRVQREVGVTVSAGVAPVKFLAKIASDWLKPNGLFVVLPTQVDVFTSRLAVGRIPGVGPVTQQKLKRLGLSTCEDIRHFGITSMVKHFGAFGEDLFKRAWGQDERQVGEGRERKSVSVERTFPADLPASELPTVIPDLLERLKGRLENGSVSVYLKKVFVKIKFDDFRQTTMECGLPGTTQRAAREDLFCIEGVVQRLAEGAWRRIQRPVRLAGVGVVLAPQKKAPVGCRQQLSLSDQW